MSKSDSLIARTADDVYGPRLDAMAASDVWAMTRLLSAGGTLLTSATLMRRWG